VRAELVAGGFPTAEEQRDKAVEEIEAALLQGGDYDGLVGDVLFLLIEGMGAGALARAINDAPDHTVAAEITPDADGNGFVITLRPKKEAAAA
jgi:hypothetical protein